MIIEYLYLFLDSKLTHEFDDMKNVSEIIYQLLCYNEELQKFQISNGHNR